MGDGSGGTREERCLCNEIVRNTEYLVVLIYHFVNCFVFYLPQYVKKCRFQILLNGIFGAHLTKQRRSSCSMTRASAFTDTCGV